LSFGILVVPLSRVIASFAQYDITTWELRVERHPSGSAESKRWITFESTRQFEFYEGERTQRSAAEAVAFLMEHLAG